MSPSTEYSGLISFRMDWMDLLAVQGTLKSLLQHHSSKASILQCSAFFTVKTLSFPSKTVSVAPASRGNLAPGGSSKSFSPVTSPTPFSSPPGGLGTLLGASG